MYMLLFHIPILHILYFNHIYWLLEREARFLDLASYQKDSQTRRKDCHNVSENLPTKIVDWESREIAYRFLFLVDRTFDRANRFLD